jgi:hypothetical protein
MIQKYQNKMLQINKQTKGLPAGTKVPIKVDKRGVPVDRVWRKKLKDAETDNCVSFARKPRTFKKEEKS